MKRNNEIFTLIYIYIYLTYIIRLKIRKSNVLTRKMSIYDPQPQVIIKILLDQIINS